MDEFFKEVHTLFFKKWICKQINDKYEIREFSSNQIYIETKYGLGEITFNPLSIIELKVTNKMTDAVDFYLHFQMSTMAHAVDLFYEMIECIVNLSAQSVVKVLLSCSGGLTTSFFAQRIQEAITLLGLDIKVEAVGYNQLFQVGNQYDVILLAPQISYLQAKVQKILVHQTVLSIPPLVFARYDVAKIISLITEANKDKKIQEKANITPISLKRDVNNQDRILCLSIYKNKQQVHIAYRLYQENKTLLNNDIIKYTISMQDIYDTLDTVLLQFPDIAIIGISLPGIINNGFLSSSYIKDIENDEIEKAFTMQYRQKIIITNDINAAAVGYYVSQNQYQTFMFLFQPISLLAGAGLIVDGKLISGYHHFAGEVSFLPLSLTKERLELSRTPEGTIELVAKTILSSMCILDPQAVILFSDLITDVNELKNEISQIISKTFVPEIIKVNNVLEYILLGQMVLCIQDKGGNKDV